jgi:hypothetical protein
MFRLPCGCDPIVGNFYAVYIRLVCGALGGPKYAGAKSKLYLESVKLQLLFWLFTVLQIWFEDAFVSLKSQYLFIFSSFYRVCISAGSAQNLFNDITYLIQISKTKGLNTESAKLHIDPFFVPVHLFEAYGLPQAWSRESVNLLNFYL